MEYFVRTNLPWIRRSWISFSELRVIVVDLRTGAEVHNEVYRGEEQMCTVLMYDTTIFVQTFRVSVWHVMYTQTSIDGFIIRSG